MMVNTEDISRESHKCEEKDPTGSSLANVLIAIAFLIGLFSLPIIFGCFIFSKITKKIWITVLSKNFPKLKFVEPDSVRTLLDTLRNQGVISVLLTVRGECDPTVIRQALENHLVEKRDKKGELSYPVLRLKLLSCWGNYAWAVSDDFNISNHVIVGSPKYRGRLVNEHNLQEYVSGITSKFLLSNQPPWQITIIPNIISTEPTYGILVRVHHLVLEEGSLSIGDFLCLKPGSDQFINEIPGSESNGREEYDVTSPLSDIAYTPNAIPTLFNRLNDSLSNHWNEFVSNFDPITSPEIMKKAPGFFSCLAVALITFVSAYKDTRKYIETSDDLIHDLTHLFSYGLRALNNERRRRNLTLSTLVLSLIITFNPVSIVINFLMFFWWTSVHCFVKFPLHLYQEYLAIKSCMNHKFNIYSNTGTGILYDYLPLIYDAGKEIFHLGKLIYYLPSAIITEMFFTSKNLEEHHLQKTSSCGRKVVAWSEPISRKYIKEIALQERVTETEVLLAMTSACIKDYFHHAHFPVPNTVSAIAKAVSYDRLLSTHDYRFDNEFRKGIVFLTLPMNKICLRKCHDDVQSISRELKRVKKSQAAVYILTSWQDYLTEIFPSIYSRIFLNYTTRKFSISILEIKEGKNNIYGGYRKTLWNDTVASIFYWRPPQSNTGMSLTIQRYGDSVRLSVMTDSLLSPQHHAPARHWGRAARKLHGHSHEDHVDNSRMIESSHLERSDQPQKETREPSETQSLGRESVNNDFIGDNNSETKDYPESQEFHSNFSEHSNGESNSSDNQLPQTTHMYDYLIKDGYNLDDFIRDARAFEDENEN